MDRSFNDVQRAVSHRVDRTYLTSNLRRGEWGGPTENARTAREVDYYERVEATDGINYECAAGNTTNQL